MRVRAREREYESVFQKTSQTTIIYECKDWKQVRHFEELCNEDLNQRRLK